MDCCLNDLGDKPHNEDIDLGIDADQDGDYIAILDFAGVKIRRKIPLITGDPIIIPRPFNEMYLYKMKVQKPDGSFLAIDDCENFIFKTYINITSSCSDCETCNPDPEPYS